MPVFEFHSLFTYQHIIKQSFWQSCNELTNFQSSRLEEIYVTSCNDEVSQLKLVSKDIDNELVYLLSEFIKGKFTYI